MVAPHNFQKFILFYEHELLRLNVTAYPYPF
ncbi:hypothetical protein Vch1786_I0534 [Vibrio cholerae O1 str. 2010EL-1786]|uniref:Uncharacterized protein n=2 Tax=Vibrio cholerae TaxID=666 RepID=Q9KT75_VIBCH|nr:hypothetical protein VC_1030 [Vibrio cholerae O1 biovar El Tor str. N16961]ACP05303.1 conserved hypothetical protein [Vibrio cholerae M66-2]ACP09056.1 conserved hypothetical protein [Vibrio cholerae O395]AET26142.1 hypothetical protein Vch1786_I0534 [Vibrio cholerae O1 str. 2010EL-1786]